MATLHTTTAAVSTPVPTSTAATPLAPQKVYTRLKSVSIQEANKKAFPRPFCIQLPNGRLWPCLCFPNFDTMMQEKDAFEEESGIVLTSGDPYWTHVAVSWSEEAEEKCQADDDAGTAPLVLLLGLNETILKPQETDMTYISHGIQQLHKDKKTNDILNEALKKLQMVVAYFSPRRGVKRGAQVLVRPPLAATARQTVTTTPVVNSTPALETPVAAASKPVASVEATAPVDVAATTTATTASGSPRTADKKMAAVEEVVPHVSPGGDSTTSDPTNRSNKRPKLSRPPVNQAEYFSLEGNRKLDEREKTCKAKPEALTQQSNKKSEQALKKTKASAVASMEKKDVVPKKKKGSVNQDVQEATNKEHPGSESRALSTSDALPKDLATLDMELTDANKENAQDVTMTESDQRASVLDNEKTGEDAPAPNLRTTQDSQEESDKTDLHAMPTKKRNGSKNEEELLRVAATVAPKASKTSAKTPAKQRKKGVKTPVRQKVVKTPAKQTKALIKTETVATKRMEKATKSQNIPTQTLNSLDSVILTEDEQKIPTFYDVKKFLEIAGFTFRAFSSPTEAEFCFPGGDPRVNKDAILGKDYFKSLESFQARLCSHGFGDSTVISHIVDTPEGAKLERWVRLGAFQPQIARLITNKLPLPDVRSKTVFFKDLQSIGFVWKNSMPAFLHGEIGGPWTEDGVPMSFVEQSDFHTHLSRFGYPKECNLGALENDEISRLVLPLVFHKRDLMDPSPCQGRRSRRRRPIDVPPEVVRSAKKTKTKEGVKSAKKHQKTQTVVKEERVSVFETPMESTEPVPSSPSKCDKVALEDCHGNPPDTMTKVIRGRDITAEIEDASNNVKKLKACLANLESTQASESTWLGDLRGHFRKNVFKVRDAMEDMIKSRRPGCSIIGQEEDRNSIYICGTAGIGKTTAVNWSAGQLIESNSSNSSRILGKGVELVVVNINCSQYASGGPTMRSAFFDRVWGECHPGVNKYKKDAEASLVRSLKSTSANVKKYFLILVLDEMDQLVDATSDTVQPKGSGEKLLRDLGDWSVKREELRFALVGIGNAMNNNKFRRTDQFVQFRHKLTFKSYDQADMEEIMRSRLEDPSVVHPSALTFIAKNTSSSSGDVRKAIEHLTTALKDASERAQEQAIIGGPVTQGQYIVNMKDVIKVNSDYIKLSGIIKELPTKDKLAVRVAANLVSKNNEGKIHRRDVISDLNEAYYEKFHELIEDPARHVDKLSDMGICVFIQNDHNHENDTIQFNFLSHELQEAADVALGNDDVYNL